MKTKDIDRKFDDGEDVMDMMDLSSAVRPNFEPKRVNVDFPTWMVESLALTGTTVSSSIFHAAEILEQDETLARMIFIITKS